MPYSLITPHPYFKYKRNRNPYYPINPHRFYKKQLGTDDDRERSRSPSPPPPPTTDCGYGEETQDDGGICYVIVHSLTDCFVNVKICVMPDGSMKTTHEVTTNVIGSQRHGVRILNDVDGNTEFRARTNDFMLYSTAPEMGDYKTLSRLYPTKNYMNQTETDAKFITQTEIIGAVTGAGSFVVALYWFWKAVAFFRDKKIGIKKLIKFRMDRPNPAVNPSRNEVRVQREGLYYNFNFTLMRGEKGDKTVCQRR